MPRFIEGQDRQQVTLMPECLDDFIADDNPVRVIDAFVNELDLAALGFEGAEPAATGRPAYHPGDLLKVYIYGYLNRVQSSRRLERECQRNLELMWLTGRLAATALHPLSAAALAVAGPVAAPDFGVLHVAGHGILTIARGTLPPPRPRGSQATL